MGEEELQNPGEETYELVLKNGALANLKKLALTFNVPENDLKLVINKGLNLLTLIDGGKNITFEDKNGDRYRIDLNKL